MAAPSFERAVAHVLKSEGGYVDHPSDPGGATNRGITLATLSKWRGRPVSKAEVKALTESEARQIYRKFYWDMVRGDDLPAGLDLAVFDFGVNSGNGRAARYLQLVLGVASDGIIGPKTLAAANKTDAPEAIRNLTARRIAFLQSLKTWPVFGKGWRKRVLSVETEALAMAGKPIPPPPDVEPIDPKEPAVPAQAQILIGALIAALVALAGYLGIDAETLKGMLP